MNNEYLKEIRRTNKQYKFFFKSHIFMSLTFLFVTMGVHYMLVHNNDNKPLWIIAVMITFYLGTALLIGNTIPKKVFLGRIHNSEKLPNGMWHYEVKTEDNSFISKCFLIQGYFLGTEYKDTRIDINDQVICIETIIGNTYIAKTNDKNDI